MEMQKIARKKVGINVKPRASHALLAKRGRYHIKGDTVTYGMGVGQGVRRAQRFPILGSPRAKVARYLNFIVYASIIFLVFRECALIFRF